MASQPNASAEVPAVFLGQLYCAEGSSDLHAEDRLSAPLTLFTSRMNAENIGGAAALQKYVQQALAAELSQTQPQPTTPSQVPPPADDANHAEVPAAAAPVQRPWKISRLPVKEGLQLLCDNPASARLIFPADDAAAAAALAEAAAGKKPADAKKPADPPPAAVQAPSALPAFWLPGMTVHVDRGSQQPPLKLLPVFLGRQQQLISALLAVELRKQRWLQERARGRSWITGGLEGVQQQLQALEGAPATSTSGSATVSATGELAVSEVPERKGVRHALSVSLLRLQSGVLGSMEGAAKFCDNYLLKSTTGPAMLGLPPRFAFKGGLLPELGARVATVNSQVMANKRNRSSMPADAWMAQVQGSCQQLSNLMRMAFSVSCARMEMVGASQTFLFSNAAASQGPALAQLPVADTSAVLLLSPSIPTNTLLQQIAESLGDGAMVARRIFQEAAQNEDAAEAVTKLLEASSGTRPSFEPFLAELRLDALEAEGTKPESFWDTSNDSTRGLLVVGDVGLTDGLRSSYGISLPLLMGAGTLPRLENMRIEAASEEAGNFPVMRG